MRHSQRQALLEATILALVAILLLYSAGTLAEVVRQLHPHSPTEKALSEKQRNRSNDCAVQNKAVVKRFNLAKIL